MGAENIEYEIYEYLKNFKTNLQIKYFIDDDEIFKNRTINGIRIISTAELKKKKEKIY